MSACSYSLLNKTLQASRLQLIIATKQVLQNGLGLLGVSAPEKM
jgi:arginyl-tRNA synthetase